LVISQFSIGKEMDEARMYFLSTIQTIIETIWLDSCNRAQRVRAVASMGFQKEKYHVQEIHCQQHRRVLKGCSIYWIVPKDQRSTGTVHEYAIQEWVLHYESILNKKLINPTLEYEHKA